MNTSSSAFKTGIPAEQAIEIQRQRIADLERDLAAYHKLFDGIPRGEQWHIVAILAGFKQQLDAKERECTELRNLLGEYIASEYPHTGSALVYMAGCGGPDKCKVCALIDKVKKVLYKFKAENEQFTK